MPASMARNGGRVQLKQSNTYHLLYTGTGAPPPELVPPSHGTPPEPAGDYESTQSSESEGVPP